MDIFLACLCILNKCIVFRLKKGLLRAWEGERSKRLLIMSEPNRSVRVKGNSCLMRQ